MIYRDPKGVFVASDMGTASVVINFLGAHDIPAQLMNQMMLGGFEGLTPYAPGISHKGMEIWVVYPEDAEKARTLLKEHGDRMAADAESRANLTGTVSVVCEECGKSADFPASDRGTVQSCPHCAKWVDVPDPNENWDEMEQAEPDE
jgi:hypothetical protein